MVSVKIKKIHGVLIEHFGEERGKDSLCRAFCKDLSEKVTFELETEGEIEA